MKVKLLINLRIGEKAFKIGEVYGLKEVKGVNPAYYETLENEKPAKIKVVKVKKTTKAKKK